MFVSPSRFLIDRYVDWGLAAEKLTLLENGLEIGEIAPPRPLAGGKATTQPLRLLRPAQPVQGHQGAGRGGGAGAGGGLGDGLGAVRLRRQPRGAAGGVPAGVQAAGADGRPARALLRQLPQSRSADADARGRLGGRAVDLVGELAGGHPGGLPARPPDHLQRHRRHGREGPQPGRRPALPRRQRREPGRSPGRGAAHSGDLGAPARPHPPAARPPARPPSSTSPSTGTFSSAVGTHPVTRRRPTASNARPSRRTGQLGLPGRRRDAAPRAAPSCGCIAARQDAMHGQRPIFSAARCAVAPAASAYAAFIGLFVNILYLVVPLYMIQVYDRVMAQPQPGHADRC